MLLGRLCTYVIFTNAQDQQQSRLSGRLTGRAGEPIPVATVKLQNTKYGVVSVQDGYYKIANVEPVSYLVHVSAIGYKIQHKQVRLRTGENGIVNFALAESTEQVETVNAIGRTKAQEVNRQAFNVTAVDATKLYNATLDISGALERVAGVRVKRVRWCRF